MLLVVAPGAARAQIAREWVNSAGGVFNTSSNWFPFGAPLAIDGAFFSLASAYTVTFPTDRTTAGAGVDAGTVTWDLDSSGAARTYTTGGLTVGPSGGAGTATLLVRDGNVTAGSVRVRGGSHLHLGPDQGTMHPPVTLNVTGALEIVSGGRFTLFDFFSNHTLNVNGNVLVDGGTLHTIGAGTGAINLAPGRTLTVQNAGSFDYRKPFILAGNTLHIRGGGMAKLEALDIATATGAGSLVVEGAGSSLSMDSSGNPLTMQTWGAAGHAASVDLRDGASASLKGGVFLAAQGGAGTSARFTIDGPGTTFTHTVIGSGGSPDQIVVGHASSGSAELTVRNGAVFDSEAGTSGNSRVIINATGRINVESGATFIAGQIERAGGSFNMAGGTVRFNQFTGNLVNPGGTLRPGRGDSPTAVVSGNYTQQSGGTLKIDIGGVLPGQVEQLAVTANAVLGGTLDLAIVDEFVPIVGNSFTVLQTVSGNVGGRFARVVGTLPLPGIGLAVTYTPTQVIARASLPGDANLNNAVNLQDFNILATNFGQSGRTWVQADFTGDGVVSLQDFNQLAAHFGLSAGPDAVVDPADWAALSAAIPEPHSPLVAGAALAAAVARRRRLRR
jgi:hypothetical protein